MYGGMVSGSGAGSTGSRKDKALISRRSMRSLHQYRQSSFCEKSPPSSVIFSRTSSSANILSNRSSKKVLNRSATVIGNRSTIAADGAVNRSANARSGMIYEKQEKETRLNTDVEVTEEDNPEGESSQESHHHTSHRSRRVNRSFYRRFLTAIKQAWTGVKLLAVFEDDDYEEEPFHRPDDINALCRTTHFSRIELQRLYRSFKDRCPTGVVTECTFKEIYCQMFPKGASASQYAHYVFLTLDRHGDGTINFEDLIALLSRLSRGTLGDRLCWIFSLYDLNNDGYISRSEMLEVVKAVYDLLGKNTTVPPVDGKTIEQKVSLLFETFDTNKDDLISLEEFVDACSKDMTLVQNLETMTFGL